MVRQTGLEPVRRLTHAPQTCLSAYSSTAAFDFTIISYRYIIVKSQFFVFTKCSQFCFLQIMCVSDLSQQLAADVIFKIHLCTQKAIFLVKTASPAVILKHPEYRLFKACFCNALQSL